MGFWGPEWGFMNFKDPLIWGSGQESGFGSEHSSFLRRVPQTCSTCFDSGKMGEGERTNISAATSEDGYGGDTNQNTFSSNSVCYVVIEPGHASKADGRGTNPG